MQQEHTEQAMAEGAEELVHSDLLLLIVGQIMGT
jgi:hypothetical protein